MIKKREIVFLYETKWNNPNGDPFTGLPRYDSNTNRALVSDLRIKRYIRDYLELKNECIFLTENLFKVPDSNWKNKTKIKKGSGASVRFNILKNYLKDTENKEVLSFHDLLPYVIDLRLFGGINTETDNAESITGAVQFSQLNPSLNKVELKDFQNTTVFPSNISETEITEETMKQGSIGSANLVPYALFLVHGWVNPYIGEKNLLTDNDVDHMLAILIDAVNNSNTRSKSNQSVVGLFVVNYKYPDSKVYGLEDTIKITDAADEFSIRSFQDYYLNLSGLIAKADMDCIENIEYFTESESIMKQLKGNHKFLLKQWK